MPLSALSRYLQIMLVAMALHGSLSSLSAQDSTVVLSDTLPGKATFFNLRRTPPNPKMSLRLSLLFPGSGQIYNGRWWKAPFVYGGVGAMVYVIHFNQDRYRRLKSAVELQLENKPHEFSTLTTSVESLRNLRNQYDKQTQLSYIGSAVVYVVIAVEAFVDAHLQNFDVNEDLGLKVKPMLIQSNGQGALPGVGLAFSFR